MLDVVTMKEIDAIFAVTDALGVHREVDCPEYEDRFACRDGTRRRSIANSHFAYSQNVLSLRLRLCFGLCPIAGMLLGTYSLWPCCSGFGKLSRLRSLSVL